MGGLLTLIACHYAEEMKHRLRDKMREIVFLGDPHMCFFFSSRRRHTRLQGDWSSDVCSSDLGVNVTALIAGLGVGGIAVALAVQNILGDLFASLSIMLDRPFVHGDFIGVGDFIDRKSVV